MSRIRINVDFDSSNPEDIALYNKIMQQENRKKSQYAKNLMRLGLIANDGAFMSSIIDIPSLAQQISDIVLFNIKESHVFSDRNAVQESTAAPQTSEPTFIHVETEKQGDQDDECALAALEMAELFF